MPAKKVHITEGQWQVWKLKHVSNWSQRRIARRLGVSESAISQRLARLEKNLDSRSGLVRGFARRRRRIRLASLSSVFNV